MDIIFIPILQVASLILTLYTYALIAYVVLNLLLNFQFINPGSPFVRSLMEFLYRLIDPALSKIRSVIPFIGPFDLSSLILLLGIYFLQSMLTRFTLYFL